MSSEFTFGDNSDKLSIFQIFMNLVDRDLTDYQITQTLTLSRLHAQLEQTRGIRLFNHPLEQTGNPSFNLPFNAVWIRFVRIRGVTSWNESMAGTAWLRSTHRRCFSCWNWFAWYVLGNMDNRSRSLMFQFHRLWKRSQRWANHRSVSGMSLCETGQLI